MSQSGFEMFSNVAGMVIVIADVIFFYALWNIFCKNKKEINTNEVVALLKNWERKKYWLLYGELQYQVDTKYIICERYLDSDKELLDYKIYCFNGSPKAILVISRENKDKKRAVFMDIEWNVISDVKDKYKYTFTPDKPSSLNNMVKAAKILSKPFPFVRIDFYEWKDKPIFGEMTFTPAAGILPAETLINGKNMGELLRI